MSTSQTPVPEDDIASTVSRDDEEEDEREGSKGDGENGEFSGEETAAAAANGSAQPPKKRKRVKYDKTSCELCKARKVKCDRAEPACSWCARHNRTCVYLERQKPGSRIGFSLELEAKVNRIDALLQALGRRVEDHIANDHSGSPATRQPPLQLDDLLTPSGQTIQSSTAHSEAFRSAGGSPFGPSSTGDPTSVQPLSKLPVSDAALGQANPPPPVSLPSQRVPYSLSSSRDLPPHDIVYALVDLYFKHCNTWCPILDRKTTFGTFFGSTSLGEADRVLLHAIVATTLRFSQDPRLSPAMKAHYHATSRQTVQIYALDNVSVEALRPLVILCLDELGASNNPRAWNLLAIAAQNVRQLDLWEESSVFLSAGAGDIPRTGSLRRVGSAPPDSWIEDEGRRRLCWMVYLLDRYATIAGTAFDFLLDDVKMKRCLPCSYDLFSRNVPVETRSWTWSEELGAATYELDHPANLGSFSYHCEILRIVSRVHLFLRDPVDLTSSAAMSHWRNTYRNLDRALDTWLQSLPSEYSKISALCHSDPASRVANWFILHSAFVTAVIRLHSTAAYPTVRSNNFVPSHYAMQRCLAAVKSLGDIAQDVLDANAIDLLGPPFAFSLWVAARLLLVHAATVECPVDPRIDFFIATLQHVGKYWEVAHDYANALARVVLRGRQGDMTFAAMRKSAQDLVTLTTSTRNSGVEPTSAQSTSLTELDSLDVFEFFNYPKVAEPASVASQPYISIGRESSCNATGGLPDAESDWLGYNLQRT